MTILYIFLLFLSLVSAVGTVMLACLALRSRSNPVAMALVNMLILIAWWSNFHFLENVSQTAVLKFFWAQCEYTSIVFIAPALLIFVLSFTHRTVWLKKRYLGPLMVIPIVSLLAVWTNNWHHLFIKDYFTVPAGGLILSGYVQGPLFVVHAVYAYLLILLSVGLIILAALHSSPAYRRQLLILLFGFLIPWITNIISVIGLIHPIKIDLTPEAFVVTGVAAYIAVFRMRLLNIRPIARNSVVDNMVDGMLVLNPEASILDVNPTMMDWLGLTSREVIGKALSDILPQLSQSQLNPASDGPVKIQTHFQDRPRTLEVRCSDIVDERELRIGQILILRDITQQERTNEALTDTLELNQHIISASAVGISVFNELGQCELANQSAAEFIGVEWQAYRQVNFHQLDHWKSARLVDLAEIILVTGESQRCFIRLNNIEGGPKHFECYLTPFISAGQKHLLILSHDISGRRWAENELRRSEVRFQSLVESMTDAVFSIGLDGQYHEMFSRSLEREELDPTRSLGFTAREYFETDSIDLHIQAKERVFQGESVMYEWSANGTSGQRFFQTSLSPICDDGIVTGAVGVSRDITGLKQLEMDLEEAKALLEQAFEQSPVPMILLSSPDGVIEMVNTASLQSLKIPPEEPIIGKSILKTPLVSNIYDSAGRMLSSEQWPLIMALRGETIQNAEYKFTFLDGSTHWVLANATPILNRAGTQAAALLVFIDITARKENEQLEREQRVMAEAFRDTAAILNSTIQLDMVLNLILTNLERLVPHDAASVVMFNKSGQVNHTRFRGYDPEEQVLILEYCENALQSTIGLGDGKKNRALIIDDIFENAETQRLIPLSRMRSFIHVPIRLKEQTIGIITLAGTTPHTFTPVHLTRLQIFADQAGMTVENARLYSEVQHLTLTDELTRVYNYRGLIELGQREFEGAQRFNRPLSVLFFDIDHFRTFNNRYSHSVGNEVLYAIAKVARECLRVVDLIARYGGEEFVAILPETELDSALQIAERLRQAVERLQVQTTFGPLSVTVSIGVAELSSEHTSLGHLIDEANQAEHLSKREGRNRVSAVDGRVVKNA